MKVSVFLRCLSFKCCNDPLVMKRGFLCQKRPPSVSAATEPVIPPKGEAPLPQKVDTPPPQKRELMQCDGATTEAPLVPSILPADPTSVRALACIQRVKGEACSRCEFAMHVQQAQESTGLPILPPCLFCGQPTGSFSDCHNDPSCSICDTLVQGQCFRCLFHRLGSRDAIAVKMVSHLDSL